MRNPENIKAVDALNPDYLGFIFYPGSPRFVPKNTILPETQAKKVGVFVDESIEQMIDLAQQFNLQAIQLHGTETPEVCQKLMHLGYEVFKAFRIDEQTQPSELEPYRGKCTLFLFDTKDQLQGGTGKKFNWKKLKELSTVAPFLLSGGIDPDDASDILTLDIPNLKGLDINSRFEIKPGLKNEPLVNHFLLQLRGSNELKEYKT